MDLQKLIVQQSKTFGDSRFILSSDRALSYEQFFSRVNHLASFLQQAGVTPGDHVVHHSPTTQASMALFYATQLLGAVFVPLNQGWSHKTCLPIVARLKPRILVGAICCGGVHCCLSDCQLEDLYRADSLNSDPVLPILSSESISTILFTSGTTGTPKGAMLTHETIYKRAELFAERYGWMPSDILLSLGDIHSIDRLRNGCIAPLFVGNSILVDTGKNNFFSRIADLIASYKVTLVSFTPSIVRQFNLSNHEVNRSSLKTLRVIGCPGSLISKEEKDRFEDLYQKRILPYYGLTETGGFCAGIFPDTPRSFDLCTGVPVACDMRVVDEAGKDVEAGERGELLIRSPIPFMNGYWGDSELTKATIRGGWLYTGDMASLDKQGALCVYGRRGDVFKNAYEELVYPEEIADVLTRHEAIHECYVFGYPDALGMTRIAAAFTASRSVDDLPLLFQELRRLVREELGSQKVPSLFKQLNAFPKTNHGKIKRREVVDIVQGRDEEIKKVLASIYARAAEMGRQLYFVTKTESTFDQTLRGIRKLTGLLRSLGLGNGERIAVISENDREVALLFLASFLNGFVVTVLEPDIKLPRAVSILKRFQPRCLFLDVEKAVYLQSDLENQTDTQYFFKIDEPTVINRVRSVLPIGASSKKAQSYYRCVRRSPEISPIFDVAAKDQTALVLFTSGTTSNPKGVELTYDNLLAHLATLKSVYGFDEATRCLNIMPLSHADGIIQGPLLCFYVCGMIYRPFSFGVPRIKEIRPALRRLKITHMIAAPTMLSLIDEYTTEKSSFFSFPEFVTIISVAAMLETELHDRLTKDFKVKLINVYGLTETVAGSLFTNPENPAQAGTVGHPVDCEARVVDSQGRPVEDGSIGELQLKGGHIMKGYFDDPFETAKVLKNGWLYTGDLASRRPEGYIIVGRKKNVIILGGFCVYPEEVSEIINTHADVEECVTLGQPSRHWGEEVASAVVLKAGREVTEREIKAHCARSLETYKIPRKIFFVESLPRGRSGKIQLERLKQVLDDRPNGGKSSVLERVKDVASECFFVGAGAMTGQSSPRDLKGWDSMGHLDFVARLEKEFSIKLSVQEILKIETLGEAVTVIESRI